MSGEWSGLRRLTYGRVRAVLEVQVVGLRGRETVSDVSRDPSTISTHAIDIDQTIGVVAEAVRDGVVDLRAVRLAIDAWEQRLPVAGSTAEAVLLQGRREVGLRDLGSAGRLGAGLGLRGRSGTGADGEQPNEGVDGEEH